MADWSLITKEVSGRCPQCQQFLRHSDIVVEWRTRAYHVHCLLDLLTAIAPPDPYAYSPPGDNWQSP